MASNFTTNNITSVKLKNIVYHLKSIPLHGTAAEWTNNSSYVPAQGEIVIYDVDSTNTEIRIKIGDGTTSVNSLPFFINKSELVQDVIEALPVYNGETI